MTVCQDDNHIRWFTLRKGELAFDAETNNYFALRVVGASDAHKVAGH